MMKSSLNASRYRHDSCDPREILSPVAKASVESFSSNDFVEEHGCVTAFKIKGDPAMRVFHLDSLVWYPGMPLWVVGTSFHGTSGAGQKIPLSLGFARGEGNTYSALALLV